jgi:Domain of unknown function (DUF5615)
MRLLLDEMWSSEIAVQLRLRGHDVIAATEPDHEARYRGIPDDELFARAQEDRRAVVTDNVGDFEPIRLAHEHEPGGHFGVVYALAPAFDRHRSGRVAGRMVTALERLLHENPGEAPTSAAHFLRAEA